MNNNISANQFVDYVLGGSYDQDAPVSYVTQIP